MQSDTGSYTAKICAWVRATHSRTTQERIFNDSLAGTLIGRQTATEVIRLIKTTDADHQPAFDELSAEFFPIPLSRSAWAEGELHIFAEGKKQVQYVILGAGLDTFAWRNQQHNIKTFEVDHPFTQRQKLNRLAALRWNIRKAVFVAVDFAQDVLQERLMKEGFDPTLPTVFTILGVSYYLEFNTFLKTMQAIAGLMQAPTRVLFDFQDGSCDSRSLKLSSFTASLGEPMAGWYEVTALKGQLRQLGYHGIFHLTPATIAERYFRQRHDGLKAYQTVHFIKAAL
ncbi:MAG: class I SAM-dependent methyltransferase [Succinivibrio sp.]|nr:class I SAM-dependent methyltransferase [Succinivibrio sp.]